MSQARRTRESPDEERRKIKLYVFFSPSLALRAKCRVRLAWLSLIQICHFYLMHVWVHCNRKSRMPWYQRLWNQRTFICREFVGFLWPIPRVTCERIAESNTKAMFTLYRIGFAQARKSCRIGLLMFTRHKNGDFGAISVTEQSCLVAISPCGASHIGQVVCHTFKNVVWTGTVRTVAEVNMWERGLEPTMTEVNVQEWGLRTKPLQPNSPKQYWLVPVLSRCCSYCTKTYPVGTYSLTSKFTCVNID